jgi:hypothetical protein
MKNEFYINDDYAGIENDNISFYYGYEHEYCKKCKKFNKCNKESHYDEREWSFFAEQNNKKVYELSKSQIEDSTTYGKDHLDMPETYLFSGINMYFNQLK